MQPLRATSYHDTSIDSEQQTTMNSNSKLSF